MLGNHVLAGGRSTKRLATVGGGLTCGPRIGAADKPSPKLRQLGEGIFVPVDGRVPGTSYHHALHSLKSHAGLPAVGGDKDANAITLADATAAAHSLFAIGVKFGARVWARFFRGFGRLRFQQP